MIRGTVPTFDVSVELPSDQIRIYQERGATWDIQMRFQLRPNLIFDLRARARLGRKSIQNTRGVPVGNIH